MISLKATVKPTHTPSFLLNQQLGWQVAPASRFLLEDRSSQTLRLGKEGVYPISPNEPRGSFGGQTLPRGIAISSLGFMLVADKQNHQILYYSNSANKLEDESSTQLAGTFQVLWQTQQDKADLDIGIPQIDDASKQASPYQLKSPSDIAFSSQGELIVADTGNHRVLIYSWPELRVRHQIDTHDLPPSAIESDAKGNIFIAFIASGEIKKYNHLWQLDTEYCVNSTGVESASAMALTHEGNLVVLCGKQHKVFLLDEKGREMPVSATGEEVFSLNFIAPPFSLKDNQLFYPQIANANCPMWQLRGVVVDARGDLVLKDADNEPLATGINLLARPRVLSLPRTGEYYSQSFDSENLGSQWHRLLILADLPQACKLSLQTYTSDVLPESLTIDEGDWSQAIVFSQDKTKQLSGGVSLEALVQSGKGRYLQIRIGFFGDGIATPAIHKIELFADRNSSLSYLPAPYRQDPESESFLDRWLSYFDTVFAEISYISSDFSRYLDPNAVPAGDFLNWLGQWFNWTFLAQWPEQTRREMIARSLEFYQMRGTLEGLSVMLQWHTGLAKEQVVIIEHYRLRTQFENENANKSDTPKWFIGQKPFTPSADQLQHYFSIILPVSVASKQDDIDRLQAVINAQKPAHTGFRLCIINPGLRVGKQSSIGIDTWLGHYPKSVVGDFKLGTSSQLTSSSSLPSNNLTQRG